MNRTLKGCAVAALCLAVAGFGATSQAALVSFETSEGYAVGDLASGTTVGDVTYSTAGNYKLVVDALPGTAWPTDSPPPITGDNGLKQVVVNGGNRAVLTLELGGALSGKALDSFNFADRGNMPRRLKVEYFGTDGNSLGHNTHSRGDQNGAGLKKAGEEIGLHGYGQSFQKISPTAPFRGLPLSKVEITSYVNNNELIAYGTGGAPGHLFDGHSVHSTHHATATFEDFNFVDATSSVSPFVGLNFDHPHAGGTPSWASNQMVDYHDGNDIDGHSVAGVATITNVSDNDHYAMELDHGWRGKGTGDEPDPIDGDHILYARHTQGDGGAIKLQLDIHNGMGLSEFWLAFRGNGTPTVTAEYFDPSGNSLGSDVRGTADAGGPSFPLSVTEGNGDVVDNYDCGDSSSPGFGLEGCSWHPKFDRFEVSAAYSGVPMSKALITIDGGGASNASYLDHFRLTPEPGSLVLLGMAGLVALRRRMA